jgi:opacity protein-like surface antigen
MMKQIVVAASTALLALTLPARAEAQAHFGIAAGASIPESSFGEVANTGFNVTGMINVGVPLSPLGFRAEAGYNRFDINRDVTSGNVRMFNGAANVILTPSSIMGAKPYLIAGVGAYNVKGTVRTSLVGGDVSTLTSDGSSDTRLGFNGGLGLTFGLGPVGTMLEARYVTVNGKNGSGSTAFVPVTFGVTF